MTTAAGAVGQRGAARAGSALHVPGAAATASASVASAVTMRHFTPYAFGGTVERSANTRAMKNRRSFLAVVAGGGVSFALLTKGAGAQTAAPSPPSPQPSRKEPSAAALAAAAAFRTFDPHLSDDTIKTIARGIDDNRSAGAQLNPKKRRLKNSDEPVARFAAAR
ncbi:MAG: hypothetical protein ABR591_00970 [Candidatus Velthaea sp.]